MTNQLSAASMQQHMEIQEIKDDVVIIKGGGMRSVLMATSLNFALKSQGEQEAIVQRYQDFLNSLDFSIQIVITSRKIDIEDYITILEQKQSKQDNELLRLQTLEYIDFVRGLTKIANIMTNNFYIVVPYSPFSTKQQNFFKSLLGSKPKAETETESFLEHKNNLWQRVEFIATGLSGIGVSAVPLKTPELIELFYKMYNPSAKEDLTPKASPDA